MSLRQTVQAIRPAGAQGAPGSDRVFVAILKPHKFPEDDITADDIFWAKCPLSKPISTLFKALRAIESQPFQLIQNSTLLIAADPVGSLSAQDGLCIIEAVFDSHVALRLPDQVSPPARLPLIDITHSAVNMSTSTNPRHSSSSEHKEQAPDTYKSEESKRIHSPSQNNDGKKFDLLRGWEDFVFERREIHERFQDSDTDDRSSQLDLQIAQEWQAFSPNQRQYFVDRAKKINFLNIAEHRAFWIYYFEKYSLEERRGLVPHSSWKATENFFAGVLDYWKYESKADRDHLCHRASESHQAYSVPPLPIGSSLPTKQVPGTIAQPTSDHVGPIVVQSQGETIEQEAHTQSVTQIKLEDRVSEQDHQDFARALQAEEGVASRFNISQLFESKSIEHIEAGAAKGVEILASIKARLASEPSEESEHWLTAVSNLQKQITLTKTVIGVVGATGAGKSSVINAILDEERLVPTNCMRACTAVVTEISYNNEEIRYRAEIDFVSSEDWLRELNTSFKDLFDGQGKVSRECANEESEAGIAYAKIKAVYPLMTKELMESTTVDKLMEHKNVKDLLGSSRTIEHNDSLLFYKKLQQYVDSKEKTFSREKKTDAEKAKAREMEFWPLIKVVRLYVKAPALATGAVIVDLPGVHDSNQARAAVAQGYLKQCTGLWIVAPITRAVDDKSAKTLLGDSFKRQLKMDGGYNSVTFICSKTDDISLTEAQDSLGLGDEVTPLYARSDKLQNEMKELKKELAGLKETRSDINAATEVADEELDIWEGLSQSLEDGNVVYAPEDKVHTKRKREDIDNKPRKKSKYTEIDIDDDFVVNDDSEDARSEAGSHSFEESQIGHREPLTQEMIDEKMAELKATRREGRRQKKLLEDQMQGIKDQITDIQHEQDEIDADLTGRCIRGRNEYSRGAIQQDFAAGIRELDQEIGEEEDAANFNPEVDVRDYDAVARSLPVFCVSSRGYQKLQGRLQKDKSLPCFRDTGETEVPALQSHCRSLTVKAREASCKRFLNNLSHLLNSLRLWSSSDGSGVKLTNDQLKREAEILNSKLNKLDTAIEHAIAKTCHSIQSEVQERIYDRFPVAIDAGENEAINIQAKWGAPVNRDNRPDGGLYWATYKATVRRDGTYLNNHFNDDLIEPVIKQIAPGWEKMFSRQLPQTVSGFAGDIHQLLLTFHDDVEKRAIANGSGTAAFQILRHQLSAYKEIAKDASTTVKDFIINTQKDINRSFVNIITDAMLQAYAITTAEYGTGSYKRMKDAMRAHVESVKTHMFNDSVQHVRLLLMQMLEDAEEVLLADMDKVFLVIKRDYVSVIIGKSQFESTSGRLSKEQRKVRRDILSIIDSTKALMEQALEPNTEDEKQHDTNLPNNSNDDRLETNTMRAVIKEEFNQHSADRESTP